MPPEGWVSTTLGEVARLTIGRTPPRAEPKYWTNSLTYPFCSIADMKERVIRPAREGITDLAEREGKAKRVPAGALLMSFKLTIGRVGLAGTDLFPNEAICWIDPIGKDVDVRYLALWLGHADLQPSGRAVKGNTLNSPALRAIPLTLPPLAEQRRIVDLLDAVDAAIDAARQQQEAVAEAREALLAEVMRPREGWPLVSVEDAFRKLPTGPLWDKKRSVPSGAVPILDQSQRGVIGYHHGAAGVTASPDDPVVTFANHTCEMRILDTSFSVIQNVFPLRGIGGKTDTRFLHYWLRGRVQIEGYKGHFPALRRMLLPLPPLMQQHRIVSLLSDVDLAFEATEQQGNALTGLRNHVLTDLLHGDHRIPESYDRLLEVV